MATVKKAAALTSQIATPVAEQIKEPAKVGVISYGLRYLRKKDGSTALQEGVNDVWTDVPMVIEK